MSSFVTDFEYANAVNLKEPVQTDTLKSIRCGDVVAANTTTCIPCVEDVSCIRIAIQLH
jgi:hypothetical protein